MTETEEESATVYDLTLSGKELDEVEARFAGTVSLKVNDGTAEVFLRNNRSAGEYEVDPEGVERLDELVDRSHVTEERIIGDGKRRRTANMGRGLLAEEDTPRLGDVLDDALVEGADAVDWDLKGGEEAVNAAEVRTVDSEQKPAEWEPDLRREFGHGSPPGAGHRLFTVRKHDVNPEELPTVFSEDEKGTDEKTREEIVKQVNRVHERGPLGDGNFPNTGRRAVVVATDVDSRATLDETTVERVFGEEDGSRPDSDEERSGETHDVFGEDSDSDEQTGGNSAPTFENGAETKYLVNYEDAETGSQFPVVTVSVDSGRVKVETTETYEAEWRDLDESGVDRLDELAEPSEETPEAEDDVTVGELVEGVVSDPGPVMEQLIDGTRDGTVQSVRRYELQNEETAEEGIGR